MKMPANTKEFMGEFIVFFSDQENPEVLYSSPIAELAYEEAQRIKKAKNKNPTVILISDNSKLSSYFFLRS